jgi:hypothetical protein
MSISEQFERYRHRIKLLESAGYKVEVHHSKGPYKCRGHSAKYHTWAAVINRKTNKAVAFGSSWCNPHDQPNRRLGWAIAVGRCLKQFDEWFESVV